MFGLEWHSEMQALCSTSLQTLFSCPLRTCSLLVQPSGKKAALTNNVWDEAKPWKKWLKRRDNPRSYSKCTFSKSHSAAWEGQCLTSYKASGSDIKFHFPNTLDKLVIEVKTIFLHMKSGLYGGQTFEIWMMELISYHLISHFFGPLYFQENTLRFDLSM